MRNLKSFILLTLIGLFIAGCATSRAVKEADQFAAQGAWDEAVLLYGNLLKEDPDDVYYKLKYRRASEKAAITGGSQCRRAPSPFQAAATSTAVTTPCQLGE